MEIMVGVRTEGQVPARSQVGVVTASMPQLGLRGM